MLVGQSPTVQQAQGLPFLVPLQLLAGPALLEGSLSSQAVAGCIVFEHALPSVLWHDPPRSVARTQSSHCGEARLSMSSCATNTRLDKTVAMARVNCLQMPDN